MANWIKVTVNVQNIKAETEKAVLIAMPHSSDFDGFEFWHPKKLVRQCKMGKGWIYSMSFTDEFEFKLKKMGQGRYNQSENRPLFKPSCFKCAQFFGRYQRESI